MVNVLPTDYAEVNEPHIHDIIMRFKTLNETRNDLVLQLQEMSDTIEKEQMTLADKIKHNNDLVLVYNSKLGLYQKKLDKMKQNTSYLEQKIQEKENIGKRQVKSRGKFNPASNSE
jgi:predicted DNA-binding protein YlxM (UPF0122 family)